MADKNQFHTLVFYNNADPPTMLEWPTDEAINKMNRFELGKYALDLFNAMNEYNVHPFTIFSMMCDFRQVQKDLGKLRGFMKRFTSIFASGGNVIEALSKIEV